jgi:hypothetical protein
MAGLLSDDHDRLHDRFGFLHLMADHFREMGDSVSDFFHCPPSLQRFSNQNDLDLFSAKRQIDGI